MTYLCGKKRTLQIEETDRQGHFHQTDYVTAEISFWQYIVPRAALTIIRGSYTSEEIDKAMEAESIRKSSSQTASSGSPEYICFTCRAQDLVGLARNIIETYEAFEHPKVTSEK